MSNDELDAYEDEDELAPLPSELASAVDELFEELGEVDDRLKDPAVRELLWGVLERIGRLEEYCLEEAGMGGLTVEEARDAEQRGRLLEEERRPRCASSFSTVGRRTPRIGVRVTSSCSSASS